MRSGFGLLGVEQKQGQSTSVCVCRRERESDSPAILRATRAELLVRVWARKVNIAMSHNPLLLRSTCGILTQKCQRSQYWFILIPQKSSHMNLSCESCISYPEHKQYMQILCVSVGG